MAVIVANALGGQPLGVVVASKALEVVTAQEIFVDGRGCTEVIEAGAHDVIVTIQKGMDLGRDITVDTGVFASEAKIPQAAQVPLQLKFVVDTPVDDPVIIDDATPVNLGERMGERIGYATYNYSNQKALGVLLAQAGTTYTAKSFSGTTTTADAYAAGDKAKALKNALIDALAGFENGDSTLGWNRFEADKAVIVVTSDARSLLIQNEMVTFKTGLDMQFNKAYVGDFMGTPVFSAPNTYFGLAYSSGGVKAVVVAGNAFVKGSGPARQVKIIDAPGGQGTRYQPMHRFGYSVANAAGVIGIKEV